MHICPYEQKCMHAHTHGYIRMLATHTHAPHIDTTYMHHTNTKHRPCIHIPHTYHHTYTTHDNIAVGQDSCLILLSSSSRSFVVVVFTSSSAIVAVGHRPRSSSSSKPVENETGYPYPYIPPKYIKIPKSRP